MRLISYLFQIDLGGSHVGQENCCSSVTAGTSLTLQMSTRAFIFLRNHHQPKKYDTIVACFPSRKKTPSGSRTVFYVFYHETAAGSDYEKKEEETTVRFFLLPFFLYIFVVTYCPRPEMFRYEKLI